ncbi:MAG: hypothetical protein DI566_12805 [Microbacterium sp.]|nr:MAG: hypothetical protein DI566_12805 [Microbacterium sp.]
MDDQTASTEAPPLDPRSDETILSSLHPDCPDWRKLGPNDDEAMIRAAAQAQQDDADARESAWSKSFNRRTFLAGGLGVGVAALASQVVTTRVSYAAAAEIDQTPGTLVVVFLRGGLDGLSLLIPKDDYLAKSRPTTYVKESDRIQLDETFGFHPALAPLKPLISAGLVAGIPAVATPLLSRSHFQAQDCLERGSSNSLSSGWLDRVLIESGPGTTFRGIGVGGLLPRALKGDSNSIGMQSPSALSLNVSKSFKPATVDALRRLYTGLDHPVSMQSLLALDALDTAERVVTQGKPSTTAFPYPKNSNLANALSSVAAAMRAGAGVRVACVDVGGWDMHTMMGNIDSGDMTDHLAHLAACLAAFAADLGEFLGTTTVVTMSEFGRRIEENASAGTDHGHGGAVLAIGGKVRGGVHGHWEKLVPGAAGNLDNGDVPGWNDYRDVLSEIVMSTLGLSAGSMARVFPDWQAKPLGVMAA